MRARCLGPVLIAIAVAAIAILAGLVALAVIGAVAPPHDPFAITRSD